MRPIIDASTLGSSKASPLWWSSTWPSASASASRSMTFRSKSATVRCSASSVPTGRGRPHLGHLQWAASGERRGPSDDDGIDQREDDEYDDTTSTATRRVRRGQTLADPGSPLLLTVYSRIP